MTVSPNAVLIVRLTHTGLYVDGRPNTASVFIPDGDWGLSQQHRKTPLYVPPNGFIDIELTSHTLYSMTKGAIAGFVTAGILRLEMLVRLRDPNDLGGILGTGAPLAGGLNVERVGNVFRFVIPASEIAGFIVGENISITGLTGAFSTLNGAHTISEVTKGEDLAGPNPMTWVVGIPSQGGALAPAALVGVVVRLSNGKVRFEARGSGNAGGLGPDSTVYVGGDLNVTGIVDPSALQITPMASADVPPGSFFVDAGTGAPYYKDQNGTLIALGGGGGGGGGGNVFTYRPGGASIPSANVFNTWEDTYAAAAAWPTTAKIIVDSTIVTPAPMPAGTWDMTGIILGGNLNSNGPFPFSQLEAQDGVVITNLLYVTDLLWFSTVSDSPVFSITGFQSFLVDFGSTFSRSGSAPMFEVSGQLNFVMLRGSNLNGGPPIIGIIPDGQVSIQLYENCSVGSDIFEGTSIQSPSLHVSDASANYSDFNPNWLGAPVQVSLGTSTANIGYYQASFYGLIENLEGTLNQLVARSLVNAVCYRPGGPNEGAYYSDFSQCATALNSIAGPKELIFDDSFGPIDLNSGGSFDMTDVVWKGPRHLNSSFVESVPISISNNTTFANVAGFGSGIQVLNLNDSTPSIFYTVGLMKVVLEGNASILSGGSHSVCHVLGSTAVVVYLKDRSALVEGSWSVFEATVAGAAITFILEDGSRIEPNTLLGNAGTNWTVRLLSPSARYSQDQAQMTSTVDVFYGYPVGGVTHITDIQTSDYNARFFDTVRVDMSAASFSVFLPDATEVPGGFVEVKGVTLGVATITVTPAGGQTIDGNPDFLLVGLISFVRLRSDGNNWMEVT